MILFYLTTNTGAFMSKSKHSAKIIEDHDGSFYCLKCGQAGFKTKSAGYGHLTTCKGYKATVNKISKELKELGLDTSSQKTEINRLGDEQELYADESSSSSAYFSKSGPTVGHPRATLGPPSGPPSGSPSNIPDEFKREMMKLKSQNEILQKLAFNHNQHYPLARQNFAGPQEMVSSTFGDLMQNPFVKMVVTLGALALVLNFVQDQFDKLDRKGKNKRN
jgi:hypothetical protein